ncbi:hypothetical protein FACS1894109_20960 [Spirochaetia bacterium]|nr:hypothetical protein FACS1894109_20960 [Spirochaetia bacterium]
MAADEALTSLTVKAVSTVDASKSGTATVTITGTATVTSVTVNPATASVAKGGNTTFTASVIGTNNPAQTVIWSINETGKNAGTTIDTTGKLTVAAGESLTSLTVKATSTVDTTKSGTATVTVTGDGDTSLVGTWVKSGGSITFTNDGNFTYSISGGSMPGTYTYSGTTLNLTITSGGSSLTGSGTAVISGNILTITGFNTFLLNNVPGTYTLSN